MGFLVDSGGSTSVHVYVGGLSATQNNNNLQHAHGWWGWGMSLWVLLCYIVCIDVQTLTSVGCIRNKPAPLKKVIVKSLRYRL